MVGPQEFLGVLGCLAALARSFGLSGRFGSIQTHGTPAVEHERAARATEETQTTPRALRHAES
ncbi:MAG: hypothetical protein JWL69_3927 [Phycisphaerales bacterium]|nr:hypothetical protein [Phycisphaerales bacterium]MDB5357285.1 hypothetical protein [Phycisphaerales bacterium]